MMAKVRALLPLLLLLTASWTVEGRGTDGIGRSPVLGRRRPSWLGGDQASHTRRQPTGQGPVGGEPPRRVEGGALGTPSLPLVTPTPTARLELRQGPGGGPGKGDIAPGKGNGGPGGGFGGGPGSGDGGRGLGQNGPGNCPTDQQLSSLSSSAASDLAAASMSFSATLSSFSTQSSMDVAAASATAAAAASSLISAAQAAAAAASSQVASINASASAVSSSLVASASSVIAAVQASAAAGATVAPVTLPPATVTVTTTVQGSMKTATMTDVVITKPSAQPEDGAHADAGDVVSSSNLSHGQLAATLVGSVIGAAAVTFIFVFVYFRRRHNQSTVVFDSAGSPGYRTGPYAAMRDTEPPSVIYPRDEKQPAELSVSPRPVPPKPPSDMGRASVVGTEPARFNENPIDFHQWSLRSGKGPPGQEPQPVRLQLARKDSSDGTNKVQVVRVPVRGHDAPDPREAMHDTGRTNPRTVRASMPESSYSTDIPPPPWAPTLPERAQRRVSGLGPLPPRRSSFQTLYANNSRLEPPPEIPRHENVTSWGSWGSALVGTQLDSHMAMLLKQPPLGQPSGSRGPSPTGDDDGDASAGGDDVSPPASPRRRHDPARGTLTSLSTRDSHTIPLSFTPLAPQGRRMQFPRKSLPASRPQMPLAVSQPQLQPAAAPPAQQQQPTQPYHAADGTSPGFAPSCAATSRASSRPSTGAGPGGLRPPPPFSLFPSPGPHHVAGAPPHVPAPLVPGGAGLAGLGIQQQAHRLSLLAAAAAAARPHSHATTDDAAARASGAAGGGDGGPATFGRFHWPLSPRFSLKPDPRI